MLLRRLLEMFCLGVALTTIASASEISKKVQTGTHRPLFWYLNVHASEEIWIKVNGKKFNHVKGYQPRYLEIENLNAVFFVTETGTSKSEQYAHFVSLDGNIASAIKFSGYIYVGSPNTPVSIVSSEWPIVVVRSSWTEFTDIFEFNLSTKTCTRKREPKAGN